MRPDSRGTGAGFQPLAPLLAAHEPERLEAARSKLEAMDRDKLITLSRNSFNQGKRVVFHLVGDELTKRGIPPAFRHLPYLDHDLTRKQAFDFLLADVRWLRRTYPDHAKTVRYKRSRDMLSFHEPAHMREVEFAFWAGRRPSWKIVASLSLTTEQQWDCYWLRSVPIKKLDAEIRAKRERVFKALQADLKGVRRTIAFTDADALETLKRRHALWICSRMASGGPTGTAARFQQLTGVPITRQAVGKQLEKIGAVLRRIEMKERDENG